MGVVTQQYVNALEPIYRDILAVFPKLEPFRKGGYGLAYQTLYEGLQSQYSMGEMIEACQNMAKGGAVTIKNDFFVHPTDLGEQIIAELTGKPVPERQQVPPFAPPR